MDHATFCVLNILPNIRGSHNTREKKKLSLTLLSYSQIQSLYIMYGATPLLPNLKLKFKSQKIAWDTRKYGKRFPSIRSVAARNLTNRWPIAENRLINAEEMDSCLSLEYLRKVKRKQSRPEFELKSLRLFSTTITLELPHLPKILFSFSKICTIEFFSASDKFCLRTLIW